jgi:hypothetical protein
LVEAARKHKGLHVRGAAGLGNLEVREDWALAAKVN